MANKICPICKEENKCMPGNNVNKDCWCTSLEIPREIFKFVPEESINKHCICVDCIEKFSKGYSPHKSVERDHIIWLWIGNPGKQKIFNFKWKVKDTFRLSLKEQKGVFLFSNYQGYFQIAAVYSMHKESGYRLPKRRIHRLLLSAMWIKMAGHILSLIQMR